MMLKKAENVWLTCVWFRNTSKEFQKHEVDIARTVGLPDMDRERKLMKKDFGLGDNFHRLQR